MQNITLENDELSRKVMQYFLLLQIVAVVLVFILIFFHLYFLALAVSFITLFIFISTFLWLYLRYQLIPVVKEKHHLQQITSLLQKSIHEEAAIVRKTKQKRESLFQDEKKENDTAVLNLQQGYIQKGLSSSYIKDAVISGVGPKLKERLATYHIFTADHVSSKILEIPGFGKVKYLALVGWRSEIYKQFDKTKPAKLPSEQLESLKQKYHALQQQNDANENKAHDNQLKLENDLRPLQLRLKHLVHITFTSYLGNSLASQGFMAVFIAFVLVAAQTISGVSATTFAIRASIPTATATPTVTPTLTNTYTPTVTFTSTATLTPTITLTSTITKTPTTTFTPLPTRTRIPTIIPTRSLPTLDPLRYVTAICMDGHYSYSRHRQGTCSDHGGVRQWINKPPD